MNKKIVMMYVGIIFIGLVFIVFGISYLRMKSPEVAKTFVVGMMSGWAPFMTVNQAGEYEGFDVDVAQKIADKLGKKLEVKDFGSLATVLVALQQNKVDCVMSGLDITQCRLKVMDMVAYTGDKVRSFYLLFWNQIPGGVTSVEDLKKIDNAIICAEPGSAQARYLEQYKYLEIKALSKIEDMVLDIKYGKSLAAIVEPQVAMRFIRNNQALKALELPISEDFQTFGMGIAFTKGNSLAQQVKVIIQELRNDGTLSLLEKKWGLTQKDQQ